MNRAKKWFLIDGSRLAVASLFVIGSFLITYWFTKLELITFQPASAVSTMYGSGVISGMFTLITITLTVNQMILSRVFGSVNELTDRIDSSLEFRHTVEDLSAQSTSPNHPDQFIVLIGETITERANAFEKHVDEAKQELELDPDLGDDADEYLSEVYAYADRIEDVKDTETTQQIVSMLLGPGYAQNLTATDRLLRKYDDELPYSVRTELEALLELLKSIGVARQFFKTIAIQQDLAQLSRMLVYIGAPVLLAVFFVTSMYTSHPTTTIAQPLLAEVVSLGVAVVFIPLSILLSYSLRVASIARYTVSTGPFIPPEEQVLS